MLARKYIKLIEEFLDHSISISQFERKYLNLFKNDPEKKDDKLFQIVNELFLDVDAYWHETTPETETEFEISEKTLRARAKKALEELNQYISDKENSPGDSN